MNQDDIRFIDAEERYYQQKLDYTQIIMRQIDKVRLSASAEWKGGYWETKPFTSGGASYEQRVYVPDTREVYINSVDALYDILLPYFDDDFEQEEENLRKEFGKIHDGIAAQEEEASKDARNQESVEHYFRPKYLNNRLKHRRRLFQAMIKLLKRGELIDSKGIREVA